MGRAHLRKGFFFQSSIFRCIFMPLLSGTDYLPVSRSTSAVRRGSWSSASLACRFDNSVSWPSLDWRVSTKVSAWAEHDGIHHPSFRGSLQSHPIPHPWDRPNPTNPSIPSTSWFLSPFLRCFFCKKDPLTHQLWKNSSSFVDMRLKEDTNGAWSLNIITEKSKT